MQEFKRFTNIVFSSNSGNSQGWSTLYKPSNTTLSKHPLLFQGSIKTLRARVKVSSIPETTFDDVRLAEMTTLERSLYFRDLEWSKPHKRLQVFLISSGKSTQIDDISLLNRYPFYWVDLLQRLTGGENLSFGVGQESQIRFKFVNDGYGLLTGFDQVDFIGTVEEQAYIEDEITEKITVSTPYNFVVNSNSTLLLPANPQRKYLAVTNYGSVDVFLNFGIAELNKGFCIKANGGTLQIDNAITLPLSAIASQQTAISAIECI